jgi:hypothetical protein
MGAAARLLLVLAALSLAVPAGAARSAIKVTGNGLGPTLRVDAQGYAEVGWKTSDGARHTLLVPPNGRVLPGGRLPGRDVSKPTTAVQIPYRRVLRRTPDGAFWALQAWQVVNGGAVDLRFSRWRGEPTTVTAHATCCRLDGETLDGAADFQAQPLFGSSPTTGGKSVRIFAYVDCFACRGDGWSRLAGVATRPPDGSYSLFIRPVWLGARYRVTLAGPNLGWTYAPDAVAVAESAIP